MILYNLIMITKEQYQKQVLEIVMSYIRVFREDMINVINEAHEGKKK